MAQIDIGKIKPVFRGSYDNSTAYVLDDIVYYNGSSYVAKTSTTGNLPTDATKWNVLASGSGGIWDSTLALGTAGKILQVNSGATALEFTDAPEGKLKQLVVASNTTGTTSSAFDMTQGGGAYAIGDVGVAHISVTFTPVSSSSKILIYASAVCGIGGNGLGYAGIYVDSACRGVVCANAYSGDAGGMSVNAWYNNTSTSNKTIQFRTMGSYGGNDCVLGSRRGTGRPTSNDGQYGNMQIMEIV